VERGGLGGEFLEENSWLLSTSSSFDVTSAGVKKKLKKKKKITK
jgi:hypothetical protein